MAEPSLFITVCGSPGSGKTLCATALGLSLNRLTGKRVLVVYTDAVCPPLPLLFPGTDRDKSGTLARILDRVRTTRSDALREILTDRRAPDLGFLGFTLRDTPRSYGLYRKERCHEIYDVLGSVCPYVIVDGSPEPGRDLFTEAALERADAVLRIRRCGPEGTVYASVHPELEKIGKLNLDVRNRAEPSDVPDDGETPDADLPYAPSLRRNLLRGLGPCGSFRDAAYQRETGRISRILSALNEESGEEKIHD